MVIYNLKQLNEIFPRLPDFDLSFILNIIHLNSQNISFIKKLRLAELLLTLTYNKSCMNSVCNVKVKSKSGNSLLPKLLPKIVW